jgi:hypothetical protein
MTADVPSLCVFCFTDVPYEDAGEPIRSLPVSGGHLVVEALPDAHAFRAAETSERLSWLIARAERHHRINERVMKRGVCVPVRFGTTIPVEEDVAAALGHLLPRLPGLFERLRDREEWGLKVSLPRAEPSDSPEVADARSGRAYLVRRQHERGAALRERTELRTAAETCYAACAELAVMAQRMPCGQKGKEHVPLLSAVYLVARTRGDAFLAAIGALEARFPWLRIVPSGPWPPYDFVSSNGAGAPEDSR